MGLERIMDLNLVVMSGRLVVPPEHQTWGDIGATRLLVCVTSERPHRRVDLVPVVLSEPLDPAVGRRLVPGQGVWLTGAVRRQFREPSPHGAPQSRIEVVAEHVTLRDTASGQD
jgi:single-stranded DNA-binding protein